MLDILREIGMIYHKVLRGGAIYVCILLEFVKDTANPWRYSLLAFSNH